MEGSRDRKLKGKATRGRKYGELKKRRQGRNEGMEGESAQERREGKGRV